MNITNLTYIKKAYEIAKKVMDAWLNGREFITTPGVGEAQYFVN